MTATDPTSTAQDQARPATPLEEADALLCDVIGLVILAASVDKDPRFRALLLDQRDILRARVRIAS